MYIAMNRFRVNQGREQDFIDIWKNRESYLDQVPGFKSFNLLRSETRDGITLFASHSVWENEQSFLDWTKSESFRKAHSRVRKTPDGIYAGSPELELFEAAL